MTLDRARQLLKVQADFGGFYNSNSAKLYQRGLKVMPGGITRIMPGRVIDPLEFIQIDQQDRELRPVVRCRPPKLLQPHLKLTLALLEPRSR